MTKRQMFFKLLFRSPNALNRGLLLTILCYSWIELKILRRFPVKWLQNNLVGLRAGSAKSGRIVCRAHEIADLDAFREVFVDKIYDLEIVPWIPDLVIDAGGHIGCFSVLCATKFPGIQIKAFEPDDGNFELLSANTRGFGQIESAKLALGNREYLGRLAGPSSMGRRLSQEGQTVNVVKLSDRVSFDGIETLLLKIDVEGAEWDVLEDCISLLPGKTALFVELHHGEEDRAAIRLFSETHGFRLVSVEGLGQFTNCMLLRN